MLTSVYDFHLHFTKHISREQKFSAKVTQNIYEIHTVVTHISPVYTVLLLMNIVSIKKSHLRVFSLTQNRFILIQVVALTYMLHVSACT
jgi:hypothetical protein